MATISGKVEDANGNGTAGVVRAYRVLTGNLVGYAKSDPSTGLYSITTPYVGEPHLVVRAVAPVIDKDPLFDNCIVGAQLQGADGGTFFPETYSDTTWTPLGEISTTTSQSPFVGGSSLLLNGASNLIYPYTAKQNILVNGKNFSYECLFRRGDTSAAGLIGHNYPSSFNNYAGWSLHINSSGNVVARVKDVSGGAEKLITGTSIVGVGVWTHAEFSLISNTGYLFVNGVLEATVPDIITTLWGMPTDEPIRIGYTQMHGDFTGHMAYVRVSNVGRHSENFLAPTAPYQTYLTYGTPTGNAQCFDYVIPT